MTWLTDFIFKSSHEEKEKNKMKNGIYHHFTISINMMLYHIAVLWSYMAILLNLSLCLPGRDRWKVKKSALLSPSSLETRLEIRLCFWWKGKVSWLCHVCILPFFGLVLCYRTTLLYQSISLVKEEEIWWWWRWWWWWCHWCHHQYGSIKWWKDFLSPKQLQHIKCTGDRRESFHFSFFKRERDIDAVSIELSLLVFWSGLVWSGALVSLSS